MQNASYNTINNFKKLLVIFWGIWWLTALWTDVTGGLAYLGWLQAEWAPSKNYPFLVESLKMYNPHKWVPTLFFIGIIAWMIVIVASFIVATTAMFLKMTYWHRVQQAFCFSMGLWLAFFLADQLVMNYELEANHMVQASFQFLSWLFLITPVQRTTADQLELQKR